MRCNICDNSLSEPVYNRMLEAWEPCPTCLAVIHDTISGYRDRASVGEDELGDDSPCIDLDTCVIEYEIGE